ncbi:Diaminopimelate epimerase-like protein [Wilcoxina mikolae CBS 423.85]|nr:Diaminopimelate epimerase-like protein [Wilcoxina mikolae CBS 423.85]
MSPHLNFTVLNVFTLSTSTPQSPGGKPLAIVHLQTNTTLTNSQKSSISRNLGYSETTFLSPPQDGNSIIEIFTEAGNAIPFGGHSTVGTAGYLYHLHPSLTSLTLHTPSGRVPSTRRTHGARIEVPGQIPTQLQLQPSSLDITAHLKSLQPGIDFVGDARAEVMAGMTFILMRVTTENGLEKLRPYPRLTELPVADNPRFVGTYFYVLHEEGTRKKVRARMFFGDEMEDAASGAAACALAAYLKTSEGLLKIDVDICQGVEMGCESVFGVSIDPLPGGTGVKVTLEGQSMVTKEGVVDVV